MCSRGRMGRAEGMRFPELDSAIDKVKDLKELMEQVNHVKRPGVEPGQTV